MHALVALVVFVLDIIAVVQVVQSRDEGLHKALWIALVVVLPFLGPLLWFFFGRKG